MTKLIFDDACQAKHVRSFYNLKLEFKKLSLHIWFLGECIKKKVLPNFTRIHTNNSLPAAAVAIKKARGF